MTTARRFVGFVALTVAATAVVLLPTGCGRNAAPPPRGPAEVGVVTLAPERVVLSKELPGRTSAFLVAEIRPQVSGLIQQRRFTEGADVRAGELLYQIDPAPYQAAYDQAAAALAVAEAGLPALRSRAARLQELVAIRAVGQQDADDAAAALAQAEANALASKAAVESARINLSYTPIRAPISGRIGKSNVTVGALATAYQPVPLAVIQQLDPIYVDVIQASADLLRLRRNHATTGSAVGESAVRTVRLLLEDGTPYPLPGTLAFRDVTVDPTTGSVTLRLIFPNPDHTLLPGMYVRAIVEEGASDQAILVPQQGVSRDVTGEAYAWVVNAEGKVEQRPLEVDQAIGDRWLVTNGLAAGDRVIVEGQQRVRPGDAVTAVPYAGGSGVGGPAAATR
ncbi:MAG TPA: efflux RND transporter periplasmic adaptor subunit [Thermoanaerobaculales bacterium]|nr:efflux RND transporter periplasmic adaptor subunit [Thermoanaerobaculales bacterium]